MSADAIRACRRLFLPRSKALKTLGHPQWQESIIVAGCPCLFNASRCTFQAKNGARLQKIECAAGYPESWFQES